MLVFLQKHEFDWQIPSQIVFSDDHMKTSPGHCGHFGHRDAWFQWDKSMISAKRVLWKIFECRVCQFSRPPRLWIDTRPSRMAIYVQMAIPNSISHTNSIRKRIPDRFSDFSVIAISLQYWSCLPYVQPSTQQWCGLLRAPPTMIVGELAAHIAIQLDPDPDLKIPSSTLPPCVSSGLGAHQRVC